jgi:hypothetical protein
MQVLSRGGSNHEVDDKSLPNMESTLIGMLASVLPNGILVVKSSKYSCILFSML